jgi:hypothetical protein
VFNSGLVTGREQRPRPDADDARRRYYGLTRLGRTVAAAEAQRLERAVAAARARNVLPKPGTV